MRRFKSHFHIKNNNRPPQLYFALIINTNPRSIRFSNHSPTKLQKVSIFLKPRPPSSLGIEMTKYFVAISASPWLLTSNSYFDRIRVLIISDFLRRERGRAWVCGCSTHIIIKIFLFYLIFVNFVYLKKKLILILFNFFKFDFFNK